ncbi:putative 40S ribosomal protein S33 [Diplonema papillatum]|nr:putative 40S ribosomal protein S33 [Diplonema papillatum]KAJ9439173.1 putative 40S ribosomal protein S33 [Diplonema papillatum]
MCDAAQSDARDVVKQSLIKALTLAQQAVCADTEGDRATALILYSESTKQLEEIIPFVPSEHAKVMTKYSSVYSRRVTELREELTCAESHDTQFVVPQFIVQFNERITPSTTKIPTPPASIRRPFWLMRILSQTVQSGANITPEVYVGKDVWTQDGAHLVVKAIPAKTKYCETVVDLLAGLQDLDTGNTALVARYLDEFLTSSDVAYKAVQRELPADAAQMQRENQAEQRTGSKTAHVARAWSAFRNRLTDTSSKKTEPSVTYNSYLPWLVSLLEACQVVDAFIALYSSPSQPPGADAVLQRLYAISTRFYSGLCAFVLRDLFTLLYRHMRKLRESYSRLFPAHFLTATSK